MAGRPDRSERLRAPKGGVWASSSQDYVRLAFLLFAQSAQHARSIDGNCSIYTIAGIPILFSALRALLIEVSSGMYGREQNSFLLNQLARSSNEVSLFSEHYAVPPELKKQLSRLYEVRNEIIHPAHMPTGTSHSTPAYLLSLRDEGLLQSTGNETCDYTWIAQLQSHRLFVHAFQVIEESATIVLTRHGEAECRNQHLESYRRYRSIFI